MKEKSINIFEVLKCSVLIAGTCIGGGMLALPHSIGSFGFLPSVVLMFISCVFMSISALLYLEATLWLEKGAHMNALSNKLLNKWWRFVCIIIYVFICYASIVAYLSLGGIEVAHVFKTTIDFRITEINGMYLFALLFGSTLILGYKFLGRVNSILFFSMIFAYIFLISIGIPKITLTNLKRESWGYGLFFTTPLMLTIFSFPGIVPSITYQLNKNAKSVRLSILIGTFLTFFVYVVWILFVIGSVPYEGDFGLEQACIFGIPISQCIYHISNSPLVSVSTQFFSFFALATSFLGISLSLFDFFLDSFGIKNRSVTTNALLSILVIFPSLIFSIFFERIFVTALEVSGGIGDVFLSGIIPVLMVWNGRYRYKYHGNYQVFGGKFLLLMISIAAISVFIAELILIFS
jgi:tyrosine-specific transport protein